ncbi:MAG: eCIS core domain-containing protein [Gemmatirosa sp.]
MRTTRRDGADATRPSPERAAAGRARTPTPAAASSRGDGRALDGATRGYMESRFGHDFADVRVHSGPEAARSAEALEASAYTVGSDIYFSDGAFAPGTVGGAHLLAHELTHVVQQDRGGTPARELSRASDGAEVEASHAADVVTAGGAVTVTASPGAAIAREEKQESPLASLSGLSTMLGFAGKSGLMGLPFMTDRGEGGFMPSIADNLGFLKPMGGVLGAMGGLDKTMSGVAEGDYLKAGSGALGMGSGLGGLVSWLGTDTLGTGMTSGIGGAAGLLGAGGSVLDAISSFSDGNYGKGAYDSTKAVGGTLSGLATLGGFSLSSVGGMSAGAALAGGGGSGLAALGPAGAVIGAGLAGASLGTYLSEETTVGENSVGALGTIDGWLTGDGEESFLQRQTENIGENWDDGNYLSAIGNGLAIGGVGLAGAVGGLAGGAVDLVGDIGGGISDLWDSIW